MGIKTQDMARRDYQGRCLRHKAPLCCPEVVDWVDMREDEEARGPSPARHKVTRW